MNTHQPPPLPERLAAILDSIYRTFAGGEAVPPQVIVFADNPEPGHEGHEAMHLFPAPWDPAGEEMADLADEVRAYARDHSARAVLSISAGNRIGDLDENLQRIKRPRPKKAPGGRGEGARRPSPLASRGHSRATRSHSGHHPRVDPVLALVYQDREGTRVGFVPIGDWKRPDPRPYEDATGHIEGVPPHLSDLMGLGKEQKQ
jgi:hypothetical protein